MTLFGLVEDKINVRSLGWLLVQCDWCLIIKRESLDRVTQEECPVKREGLSDVSVGQGMPWFMSSQVEGIKIPQKEATPTC